MNDKLTFLAYINVATPSHPGRLAGGVALTALAVISIAWGVIAKRPFTLMLVVLLVFGVSMIRGSGGGSQMVPVEATLEVDADRLLLYLPGTKLLNGRYVNQIYMTDVSDVDGVGFLDGRMAIRSRVLTSVGMDGAQVVSQKTLRQYEVSLVMPEESAIQAEAFLRDHGLPVFS